MLKKLFALFRKSSLPSEVKVWAADGSLECHLDMNTRTVLFASDGDYQTSADERFNKAIETHGMR